MANYYTLQVHYGSMTETKTMEFKDLALPEGRELQEWAKEIRSKLFTTGFQFTTAPGTIKFIHPMYVTDAYLIKQDKKFAI